jgi:hypothetical protein
MTRFFFIVLNEMAAMARRIKYRLKQPGGDSYCDCDCEGEYYWETL